MSGLALPIFSGGLLVLSFPPIATSLLPFIALSPLAVFVATEQPGAKGRLAAAKGGLLTGGVFFGSVLHWIPMALADAPLVAAGAYVGAVALFAHVIAAASWLLHRLLHDARMPLWLALALTWTSMEWLRGHLPGGFAFPWLPLSVSLSGFPDALTLAELSGDSGVTFWLCAINGLVAETVVDWLGDRGAPAGKGSAVRRLRPVGVACVVGMAPVVWGLSRSPSPNRSEALEVAVLQTDVSRTERDDPVTGARVAREAIDRLTARLPSGLDLVVLPETILPVALDGPEAIQDLAWLERLASRLRTTLLVGAFATRSVDGVSGSAGTALAFNSAFLVAAEGVLGRYDKRLLVPGVERVPLVPSPVLEAMGDPASLRRGSPGPLPRVGGVTLGPMICYEAAFGDLARDHLRRGADLLVNVTNDAWFGGWGVAGSVARAQHEAHLVLRAVETRTTVLRSANLGRAMVVSSVGRRVAEGPAGGEAALVARVPKQAGGPTPFVRFGDLVGLGSVVAVTLLLLLQLWTIRGLPAWARGMRRLERG